jgi:NADH:ubiquinone reductase (H+-translocating)
MDRTAGSGAPTHRVVIVGGGFGGLFAARALRRSDVAITLVDRAQHHLFQPLLAMGARCSPSSARIASGSRLPFSQVVRHWGPRWRSPRHQRG